MTRCAKRGFTTVELMIVVLVIGILSAIAFPIYTSYSTRTKVAEIILAASRCRTTITEVFQGATISLPGPMGWGCESAAPTSKYVASIGTDGTGKITVTTRDLPPDAQGTITLRPIGAGIGIPPKIWICGGTVPAKFRPESCQG